MCWWFHLGRDVPDKLSDIRFLYVKVGHEIAIFQNHVCFVDFDNILQDYQCVTQSFAIVLRIRCCYFPCLPALAPKPGLTALRRACTWSRGIVHRNFLGRKLSSRAWVLEFRHGLFEFNLLAHSVFLVISVSCDRGRNFGCFRALVFTTFENIDISEFHAIFWHGLWRRSFLCTGDRASNLSLAPGRRRQVLAEEKTDS